MENDAVIHLAYDGCGDAPLKLACTRKSCNTGVHTSVFPRNVTCKKCLRIILKYGYYKGLPVDEPNCKQWKEVRHKYFKKPKFTIKTYRNNGNLLRYGRDLTQQQIDAMLGGEVFTLLDEQSKPYKSVFMDSYNTIRESAFDSYNLYLFNLKYDNRNSKLHKLWIKTKLNWHLHKNPIEGCKRNNWFQCLIKTIRALFGLKSHLSGTYWDFPKFSNDGISRGQGKRY